MEAGQQVAFMAPTELLAEQHFNKFAPLVGWNCRSPSPGSPAALRRVSQRRRAACKRGGGNSYRRRHHALFQKKVSFARLGLVVVDEQHRFGVEQRLALRSRGQPTPTACWRPTSS